MDRIPALPAIAAGQMALPVNLVVFAVAAILAFMRNLNGVFHSFDGLYMFIEVLNRAAPVQPLLAFSNDLLQSIGNIQLLQNPRLQFYFWPIVWIADRDVSRVAVYLLVALIVFLSAYGLARLLSQSRLTALVAGWVVGVIATAFVPIPFFYPIISVAPFTVLLVACPVLGFGLLRLAGRYSLVVDGLAALGLTLLVLYLLAANLALFTLLAPGAVPYVALAMLLAERRSELVRKGVVLAAVVVVALCLRWPWYVLGLFSYTAANVFPADFTVVYRDPIYVSILFQGSVFGWAGPAFVAAAAVGALLSLRRSAGPLRAAAWVLLATVGVLIVCVLVLLAAKDWILPPPIYVEIAFWPLYAVFSAVALVRIVGFAAGRLAARRSAAVGGKPALLLPVPAVLVAALLAFSRQPTDFAPFPPRDTPIVDALKANIALLPGSNFNGRVATIIPVDAAGPDPWVQQYKAAYHFWEVVGNDQMSLGLWYFRIPTLFEYNQFASPVFHALVKRTLQQPVMAHQRNIVIVSRANERVLALLGVRYAVMPQATSPIGVQRVAEDVAGRSWGLFELAAPNLATYSPTVIDVRHSLASTLDFVADDNVDLAKQAVAAEEIGPLMPAEASRLSMSDGDLRIVARSPGRSLLIVPVEFSRCLELRHRGTALNARLVRIDGVLTGVVFEREIDAVIAFRTSPLHNPTCRWRDYQELRAMLL
jgi:hypothetical protein